MSIKKNIETIQNKINSISQDITLVAVSKFHSAQSIEEAYHCGLRDFGENYIQEWLEKKEALSHLKDIRWHIIGKLQKNKVKFLTENIYMLQSLDSLSLAKEIEKKWTAEKPLNVLVQIQVDANDVHKSGVPQEHSKELCEFILQSSHLNLMGFMGIGPNTTDEAKLNSLYQQFSTHCNALWACFPTKRNQKIVISLGMSQDLEIALACGSTMARIGTALFGERSRQLSSTRP
jgi:pyridoxal phosphate enzyme (YggS family)